MFKQIAIIEKSKIIKNGLSLILKNHEICHQVLEYDDIENFGNSLSNKKPDLIILNPEVITGTASKFKAKFNSGNNIPLIAIVYQYYYPKELSENFDEILYITDSEEIISNKLKNLYIHEDENIENSEKLTERETEVLKLLLKGFSNKEVARELNISPHTVITHRKNIIEKTGIKSLSGLAVYAILNNITDIEDLKQ